MCPATPAVKRKLRAGPALAAGPVIAGPVIAGPVIAGPVIASPVIASRSAPIFPRYDARSW